jgi:hypothetical protein
MNQSLPVRVRPRVPPRRDSNLDFGRGYAARAADRLEGAKQRYSGGCHVSASVVRQPPLLGEALETIKSLRVRAGGYLTRTIGGAW